MKKITDLSRLDNLDKNTVLIYSTQKHKELFNITSPKEYGIIATKEEIIACRMALVHAKDFSLKPVQNALWKLLFEKELKSAALIYGYLIKETRTDITDVLTVLNMHKDLNEVSTVDTEIKNMSDLEELNENTDIFESNESLFMMPSASDETDTEVIEFEEDNIQVFEDTSTLTSNTINNLNASDVESIVANGLLDELTEEHELQSVVVPKPTSSILEENDISDIIYAEVKTDIVQETETSIPVATDTTTEHVTEDLNIDDDSVLDSLNALQTKSIHEDNMENIADKVDFSNLVKSKQSSSGNQFSAFEMQTILQNKERAFYFMLDCIDKEKLLAHLS